VSSEVFQFIDLLLPLEHHFLERAELAASVGRVDDARALVADLHDLRSCETGASLAWSRRLKGFTQPGALERYLPSTAAKNSFTAALKAWG
jgi:hypothetical protein